MSQALIDLDISHEEFKRIVDEKKSMKSNVSKYQMYQSIKVSNERKY